MNEKRFRRELGYTIRNLRKARKLTQAELGRKLGVGQTSVANYENGKRDFSITTLVRLEEELGNIWSVTKLKGLL
jgi:transcriptional regulator with XRE-family HTH domain